MNGIESIGNGGMRLILTMVNWYNAKVNECRVESMMATET